MSFAVISCKMMFMEWTSTQREEDSSVMVGILPVVREHIVATPDTCGGKPRIAGSRIRVKDVVIMHERQKIEPAEIVSEFPHLSLADIHAALTYYHDHREEINAEIAADRAWYEEQKETKPSGSRMLLRLGWPMPKTIRFHLERIAPQAIAAGLRRHGIKPLPRASRS